MDSNLVNIALIVLPFLAESLKRLIPEEVRSRESTKIVVYAGIGAIAVAASYAIAAFGTPATADFSLIWATAGKIFAGSVALYDGGKLIKRYVNHG